MFNMNEINSFWFVFKENKYVYEKSMSKNEKIILILKEKLFKMMSDKILVVDLCFVLS